MSEGKHTPGPWIVTATEDCYCVANAGRYVIVPERGKVKADNSEADARLIAAAPELLEALEEALLDLEYLRDARDSDYARPHDDVIASVIAAIAKAKGEA